MTTAYIQYLIYYFLRIVQYLILARVIISWLPIQKDNQLIRTLYQLTEPILAPIRGLIERSPLGRNMMFDFSPILAYLLISIIAAYVR